MKAKSIITAALLILFVFAFAQISISAELKQGDKIKIITPETLARLCPHPNCGSNQHITRIPQGTILEIEGINTRMDGLQGAVLNIKLKYLAQWTEKRQKAAQLYNEFLGEVSQIISVLLTPYKVEFSEFYLVGSLTGWDPTTSLPMNGTGFNLFEITSIVIQFLPSLLNCTFLSEIIQF